MLLGVSWSLDILNKVLSTLSIVGYFVILFILLYITSNKNNKK